MSASSLVTVGRIGALWRYPVKSMLGEPLTSVDVSETGFHGDRRFGVVDGEAVLKRVPRGYPADHPAEHWLRFRSFTATRDLTQAEVTSPRLPAILARDFAALVPLVRWLNAAIGYQPAERRF